MANMTPSGQSRHQGAGQTASELKQKAQDTAQGVADKAKDVASSVADQARGAASAVADKASDVAHGVSDRADQAASSVGSGMQSLAGSLREKMPHEGMMGRASDAVADTLESGGRYLQEEGFSGLASDLTDLIRRNPIPALFAGIAIGYLIARSTRS